MHVGTKYTGRCQYRLATPSHTSFAARRQQVRYFRASSAHSSQTTPSWACTRGCTPVPGLPTHGNPVQTHHTRTQHQRTRGIHRHGRIAGLQPQPAKLEPRNFPVYQMEEQVVGRQAVEERVHAARLQKPADRRSTDETVAGASAKRETMKSVTAAPHQRRQATAHAQAP
jgi:hypothetical protein